MDSKLFLCTFYVFIDNCLTKEYFPYRDTQDVVYNTKKVEFLLRILHKSIEMVSSKNQVSNVILEIELLIAQSNLQYADNHLEHFHTIKIGKLLKETIRSLRYCRDYMQFNYKDNITQETMDNFVAHDRIFLDMMQPLSLGHLNLTKTKNFTELDSKSENIWPFDKKYFVIDNCLRNLMKNGFVVPQLSETDMEQKCYFYHINAMQGVLLDSSAIYIAASRYFKVKRKVTFYMDLETICQRAYNEMALIEQWRYLNSITGIFSLHLSICGSFGMGEFVKTRWIERIVSWHNSDGGFNIPAVTTDMLTLTGEVITCITLYIRALLGQ